MRDDGEVAEPVQASPARGAGLLERLTFESAAVGFGERPVGLPLLRDQVFEGERLGERGDIGLVRVQAPSTAANAMTRRGWETVP